MELRLAGGQKVASDDYLIPKAARRVIEFLDSVPDGDMFYIPDICNALGYINHSTVREIAPLPCLSDYRVKHRHPVTNTRSFAYANKNTIAFIKAEREKNDA